LEILLHNKSPTNTTLVQYCLNGLLGEHPQIRYDSVKLLYRILVILKLRAISQGTIKISSLKRTISQDELPDLLDISSFNNASPNSAAYVDVNEGFFCWPKNIKVYQVVSESDFTFLDETSKGSHEAILAKIDDQVFWKKMMEFSSQELNSGVAESFSYIAAGSSFHNNRFL
jgi:hypothetical protein